MYFNHENRDLRISSLSPAQDFSHVAGPMLQLCLPKELAAKKGELMRILGVFLGW